MLPPKDATTKTHACLVVLCKDVQVGEYARVFGATREHRTRAESFAKEHNDMGGDVNGLRTTARDWMNPKEPDWQDNWWAVVIREKANEYGEICP